MKHIIFMLCIVAMSTICVNAFSGNATQDKQQGDTRHRSSKKTTSKKTKQPSTIAFDSIINSQNQEISLLKKEHEQCKEKMRAMEYELNNLSAYIKQKKSDALPLVIALLSLLTSVTSVFLLYKKKLLIKDSDLSSFREIENKCSQEAEGLKQQIKNLSEKSEKCQEDILNLEKRVTDQSSSFHSNNQQKPNIDSHSNPVIPKKEKVKFSFFSNGKLSNGSIILEKGDENNKQYLMFVVEVEGNTACVKFNSSSLGYTLNRVDQLDKLVDCDIKNRNTPSEITTKTPGKAQLENGRWVITNKPQLLIK